MNLKGISAEGLVDREGIDGSTYAKRGRAPKDSKQDVATRAEGGVRGVARITKIRRARHKAGGFDSQSSSWWRRPCIPEIFLKGCEPMRLQCRQYLTASDHA